MANGRAAGVSDIKAEMVKILPKEMVDRIRRFYNRVLKTQIVPKKWKHILIFPLVKDNKSYRPIALTEIPRKLFEKLILRKMEIKLNDYQAGFIKARSVHDHLLLYDDTLRRAKNLISVTLDIKSAYDSVDRQILYEKLRSKQVPNNLLRLLIELNEKNQIQIRNTEAKSRKFELVRGVPQGCILSPLLFNVFIDDVFDVIPVNLRKNMLLFADDILIFNEKQENIQVMISALERHAVANNYRFKPEKCFFMTPRADINIRINNQEIKREEKLKYLGTMFNQKGFDIKANCNRMTAQAMYMLRLVKPVANKLARTRKLHKLVVLYKTYIRSLMEFFLPTIGNLKTGIAKLETVQKKALKYLLDIPLNTPTKVLMGLCELEGMETRSKLLNKNLAARILGNDNNPTKSILRAASMRNRITAKIMADSLGDSRTNKEIKTQEILIRKKTLFGEEEYTRYKLKSFNKYVSLKSILKENYSRRQYDNEILDEEVFTRVVDRIKDLL